MSVLRVREPFACDVNGVPHVFRVGDLVDTNSGVVTEKRRHFFESTDTAASRGPVVAPVEQATAAPGEKRPYVKRTYETPTLGGGK